MEILFRKGSKVIIRAKDKRLWLAKRKKYKHDNRRKKFTRVTYIPIREVFMHKTRDNNIIYC